MADADLAAGGLSHTEEGAGLLSAGFLGLVFTQLLTAVNDNIFRWLVIGIGKDYVTAENISGVLMIGTASFVLPYLVLAAPAGYLADRYSKRSVIVACKVAEILIMALGVVAILSQQLWFLFIVVALMGAQSALFSPAKLGAIPETLKASRISAANGLFGLATVAATVIGMGLGGWLRDATGTKGLEHWWMSAAVLIAVAIVGTICSLAIKQFPAANPGRTFPWDAPLQTIRDIRILSFQRPMLRVALGLVFFWAVGALAQLNIDQFATESGGLFESDRTPFLICLVLGVGAGSVMAGIWSAGRVELGILPLGALGVTVFSMLLCTVSDAIIDPAVTVTSGMVWACFLLFALGASAGLFDVPLESYMQHRSPRESRGSVLAAANFMTFTGVLLTALLFAGLRMPINGEPLLSARQIFLVVGILTLPVFVYVIWLIPQASIRFFVWLASKTVYRIRVIDRENLPETGGALLVSNHVSWLDGILFLMTSSRPVRLVAWAGNFKNPVLLRMAKFWGVILITGGPKSIVAALRTARQALLDGELVGIFPEGGITRSGQIQAFRPGMMKILEGTNAPVIPVYLDGLWGSIFSFQGGKFFWKMPRKWPYPISIYFGKPIASPDDVHCVRQAVQKLGASAVEQRRQTLMQPPRSFIRRCKQRLRQAKIADSTGAELTGGSALMRTLVLRRLLRRRVLGKDERYVGVLLPPSVGGVVVNMAVAIDRRIGVNLNYTVSSAVMNQCLAQCGIKHVLTSRKFMDKMNFKLDAEIVYLEDFKDQPTLVDKVVAATQAFAVPSGVLERSLGLHKIDMDDVLTVIFTSGSTGTPKGVMLTHANIASNADAIGQVVHLASKDVLLGILPFFHSFGYTITLWGTMTLNIKGAYHFSPLDGKQVGKLCEQNGGTLLLATPTFLRTYLRRCTKEEFASLDVVVAGAEKLPLDLIAAFEEKFGVRPVEGYGTTELSPLVSVNIPPTRRSDNFQTDCKEGTVGRPVPGVSAKILDLDTGAELGANQPGMLWITGPNVMKGYLDQPEQTAAVIKDGWYKTGDVALIDDEGFIKITGRISRFSKIGGEMVPHIKIEETLTGLIGASEEEGLKAVVTAVPDVKKGERLIVIHTQLHKASDELRKGLSEAGLPNIFIPAADSFLQVNELPLLGSGKLDLKAIQKIALDKFGEQA